MRNYLLLGLLAFSLAGCQTINTPSLFTSPASADTLITESIQNAFAENTQLSAAPIHIETTQGNVSLTGYVKTIRQSDTAEIVASQITGVKRVENGLIVRK